MTDFPARDKIGVCFAHSAYHVRNAFLPHGGDIRSWEVREGAALNDAVHDADVLVISGMWSDDLIDRAPKLRYVQSVSAGVDQYSKDRLRERGIRLASGQGVNSTAVAQQAITLMLALIRRLHLARDDQSRAFWRGPALEIEDREDELGGKVVVIVGLGRIGTALAELCTAFGMKVIGLRRNVQAAPRGGSAEVRQISELNDVLPLADFVVLSCPHTPQTENLINADTLSMMKASSFLVNVGRGACVDEDALSDALAARRISGAGLDVFRHEPLPDSSPLWRIPSVIVTPHRGGETRRYEENVVDILLENLDRLWRGETALRNQIV